MYSSCLKILILLFIAFPSLGQKKEVIYYDQNWQETTKEKASFYRNVPLEEKDGMVLIKDYYISGAIQMTGWAQKDDENSFEGTVTWFSENGTPSTEGDYKNGAVDGEYKVFHENGKPKTITSYKNSLRDGLSISFNKAGEQTSIVTYKADQPYEGTFITEEDDFTYITTYQEGKKEVEEVQLDNEKIARGSYQEEKPYDGSFVDNSILSDFLTCYKIYSLKNGKEEGKQEIKQIKDHKVIAYYSIKDGLKDGENFLYDFQFGQTHILEYKNGLPFEGELLDENYDVLTYKGGILEKKKVREVSIEFFEFYENDKKTQVEYSFFEINGENKQIGVYKNDKPYEGYFLRPGFAFPILDFYEKGIKKYQYSKRILKDAIGLNAKQLMTPIRSIYKENEIYTGIKYTVTGKYLFTDGLLENGQLNEVSISAFFLNEGISTTCKKVDNQLEITEYPKNDSLKLIINEKEISLVYNHTVLEKRKNEDIKNKREIYYFAGDTLKSYTLWVLSEAAEDKMWQYRNNDKLSSRESFLTTLYKKSTPNIALNLKEFDTYFTRLHESIRFQEGIEKIGSLTYDELGKPNRGYIITQTNDLFDVKTYSNGVLKESKSELTKEELKTYVTSYFIFNR